MTPPAKAAGAAMMASRLSSGVRRGRRLKPSVKPARFAAHQNQRQLRDPRERDRQRQRIADLQPKRLVDAHAIASDPSRPRAAPISTAMMKTMFSTTGAAAAAINRPVAFSTPDTRAAREMNKM